MNINIWIADNKLKAEFLDENIIEVEDIGTFILIPPKEGKIFTDTFRLSLTKEEKIKGKEVDNYLFEFGGKFYYTPVGSENKPKLIPFKYLGKSEDISDFEFAYLGIHGKYELLNGSRDYKDWCIKAKFHSFQVLGICERNTLAGTLPFQLACKNADIKSILGEEVTVKLIDDSRVDFKLYVKNEIGWRNLLLINTEINVHNDKYIEEDRLLELGEGLILVLNDHFPNKKDLKAYNDSFEVVYYQIDSVVWNDDNKEKRYLERLNKYIKEYIKIIPPILINDSYYLDKEDSHIKKILNKIGDHTHQNIATNQYFKDIQDNYMVLDPLFKEDDKDKFFELFVNSIENAKIVGDSCSFEIETGTFYLPKFSLDHLPEEYKSKGTNEELFWYLVEKGIEKRGIHNFDNYDAYLERIGKEFEVIQKGGFVDYFLILWDIIRFCENNNILIGMGRGSAGGSAIALTLNIHYLDPIQHGLLFERFLNEGRLNSLPDIDLDVEGLRRGEVKKYMEEVYGHDYVCSIGTYGTLKIKAALKDLSRAKGIQMTTIDYICEDLLELDDDSDWKEIFINASEKPVVKKFIQEHPDIINDVQICLEEPKSTSIHACGMVILPRGFGKDMYSWIPVRKDVKDDDELIVSEWEMGEIEKAGFLKEDILGLLQLDKFRGILNHITEQTGELVDIYNLPLDDPKVYELFQKGLNSDVFHFNTSGLTGYLIDLQPENINDLIAAISLFRPGPIQSKTHDEYIKLKNGIGEVHYDYMLEEVTKDTYGLFIYQEQIMKACQVLSGFSLVEADDIRKAMGKKKPELIEKYRIHFIDGAMDNGCEEDEAIEIWEKLERFAGYGLNRSHAAAYAITGYIGQYLKANYPLEFWTVTLQKAKDKLIPHYISEINKLDTPIQVVSPDVNGSRSELYTDFETNKIYWSFINVKNVGPVAVDALMKERNKNGKYYSFAEFCDRHAKTKVNKTNIENLILCGAFDELEGITDIRKRYDLMAKYYELNKTKEKDYKLPTDQGRVQEYWWSLKQRELCGLGYINYRDILVNNKDLKKYKDFYVDPLESTFDFNIDKEVIMGGVFVKYIQRKSSRGPFAEIQFEHNNDLMYCTFWNEAWEKYQELIKSLDTQTVIFIKGKLKKDHYKKTNVIYSNEHCFIKSLK